MYKVLAVVTLVVMLVAMACGSQQATVNTLAILSAIYWIGGEILAALPGAAS